jgi:hypothetical protein
MIDPKSTNRAESVTCSCGANYERKLVQLPIKDMGEFSCGLCGRVLESWRGRLVPAFKLVPGYR